MIVWGVILVLIIIGTVIGIVLLNNGTGSDSIEEVENGEQGGRADYSDEARAKVEELEEEEKSDDVKYNSTISGVITHQAIENGRFVLRVVVDQPIDSEGACRLSILSDGIEKHNSVVLMEPNSANYSCSFNIPLDEYSKGNYNFDVKLETNSQSGDLKGKFIYE